MQPMTPVRMPSPNQRHLKDKSRKSQMARRTSTREVADSDVLDLLGRCLDGIVEEGHLLKNSR